MEIWDSSAVLPLVFEQEPHSRRCRAAFAERQAKAVAFVTRIECRSGIERLARAGAVTPDQHDRGIRALDDLLDEFDIVPFSSTVETRSLELLARHELRALDAMQLACAVVLRGGRAHRDVGFVCCDRRLARAAAAEGVTLRL